MDMVSRTRQKSLPLADTDSDMSSGIVDSPVYLDDCQVLVANNDVSAFTKTVPNETAQLIVSSPPYNIGKPYERRVEFKKYLSWQATVLAECARVLKRGGSLCWEVGNYVENGEVYPLDIYFYGEIKRQGLSLRNRIVWSFEHGLHATKRFSGRYETILWFTKGDPYVFNLDEVRVPQKYPGKTHYKGPNMGRPSCNPKGKNPGDVWKVLEDDWSTLIWDIPNVKSNHPEKTLHPAQYPIELVERLVLALTRERDIVFDPFMGVGSALVAATLHGRRAMGVDNNRAYVDIATERIRKALSGDLKYRALGTKKHEPTGKERVSLRPSEWG